MGHKQLGRHVAKCPGRDHRHQLVPHAVHRLLAGLFHEWHHERRGRGYGPLSLRNGTRAYLCPGDDGNSFTLSAERFGRYGDDQHFDGVFYRNADFYAYTDMENAEFYEDEYSTFYIWYYDGVNRYLLGNDYTIGEDGLAYHDEDGLIYPAGWIPEEPYDPAVDWGANWMDSWDI